MYYHAEEVAYRERKEDLSTISLHGFILNTTEKKRTCGIYVQSYWGWYAKLCTAGIIVYAL
jgi:hypothetical protein